MKSKQVLDVQQMQHLQELGLELDYNTVLSWIVDERGKDKPLLCISSEAVDYVDFSHYCLPAYTLQDVLDVLPNRIYDKGAFYLGCYDIMIDEHDICYAKWCGSEIESTYVEIEIKDYLIDAAYELLVWCIENKFVETNKNE